MTQRYFEDINIDDELEPLERLPSEDTAIDFFGRGNPTNPAFADAAAGRQQGFGGALVPGLLKISWMTEYAGRWAGPESRVKSIRVAFRRPDLAGKPLVLAGRVVDKREEDGKKVVELEVAPLAGGEPSVRGNIQVEVPSRG